MAFELRPYRSSDEDAAIALWQSSWQEAYPGIDFAARVGWWRERWRGELVAMLVYYGRAPVPIINTSHVFDLLAIAYVVLTIGVLFRRV